MKAENSTILIYSTAAVLTRFMILTVIANKKGSIRAFLLHQIRSIFILMEKIRQLNFDSARYVEISPPAIFVS